GKCDYREEKHRRRFQLPDDLSGKIVLDLGTFDGYWAIEAKKRGASVLAVDRWEPMLETAKLALGAYEIDYLCLGDLNYPISNKFESLFAGFDVVLFYGILYHLKNPYQGFENAARLLRPGGRVIVESAVDQGKMEPVRRVGDAPPLLWVIDKVHHGDVTNYFMPNTAAIIQLAKMAGLSRYGEIIYSDDGYRVGMTFEKI
ncbi:MAG: class I SAM-dependent methyltransferase, partial [Syntrophales bacterium]